MGKAALAVVLVGLGLLGAVLLTRESRGSRPAVEPAATPRQEPLPDRIELAAPSRASSAAREEVANTEVADDAVRLSGSVLVAGEHGFQRVEGTGSFTIHAWSASRHTGWVVPIEDGRWSTDARTGFGGLDSISADEFVLGGRKLLALEPGRRPIPADGRVDWRVEWKPPALLRVRDRASGRDLDPVLLARGSGSFLRTQHPGTSVQEQNVGPSPVALSAEWIAQPGALFVRSPGYAWSRADIDPSFEGERFAELEPGGELELIFEQEPSVPTTELSLSTQEGRRVFDELLWKATDLVVADLAPGSLLLSPGARSPIAVSITAGKRTTVRIPAATPAPFASEPSARVPLAGWLVVPHEWEAEDFQLELTCLDASDETGRSSIPDTSMGRTGSSDEYRWDAGRVSPGHYEASIDALKFRSFFEVGADGLQDLRIAVPPPCEVAVRCVDADSGDDARVDIVSWYGDDGGGFEARTRWDEPSQRWRFRAPVAGIQIRAIGPDRESDDQNVQLHTGWNDVTLSVARLSGLTPILRDGASTLRWRPDFPPTLRAAEGQRESLSGRSSPDGMTLLVKHAGLYTLVVPPIPGYEPVPDEVVEIEKGIVKKHVIELRRKP